MQMQKQNTSCLRNDSCSMWYKHYDNMTWKTNEVQKGTERKQKCCVLLDVCLWVWTAEYPSNLCPTKRKSLTSSFVTRLIVHSFLFDVNLIFLSTHNKEYQTTHLVGKRGSYSSTPCCDEKRNKSDEKFGLSVTDSRWQQGCTTAEKKEPLSNYRVQLEMFK